MFSKEEKRSLRNDFWLQFKSYSNKRKLKAGKPGRWIMDKTGIKGLSLKFHLDEEYAWAGIEIDTKSLDKKITLFDKFEKLKTIISSAVPVELIWELEEHVSESKSVSRIYVQSNDYNIYDTKCWKSANKFFYDLMDPIEDVFIEYHDYIKY